MILPLLLFLVCFCLPHLTWLRSFSSCHPCDSEIRPKPLRTVFQKIASPVLEWVNMALSASPSRQTQPHRGGGGGVLGVGLFFYLFFGGGGGGGLGGGGGGVGVFFFVGVIGGGVFLGGGVGGLGVVGGGMFGEVVWGGIAMDAFSQTT